MVVTEALLHPDNSVADAILRDVLLRALARFVTTQFLLPTVAASDGNPGAITNGAGATAVTSTGSSPEPKSRRTWGR